MKTSRDGLALLRQTNCDLVIGLGGRQPDGCGEKVIAVAATNDTPLRGVCGLSSHRARRPAAGMHPDDGRTGSEVTKVAVITDTERDVKMMMLDVHLLARVALVDFELSLTMQPTHRARRRGHAHAWNRSLRVKEGESADRPAGAGVRPPDGSQSLHCLGGAGEPPGARGDDARGVPWRDGVLPTAAFVSFTA